MDNGERQDIEKVARAEIIGMQIANLIDDAELYNFWFEAARGDGDELSYLDINWKDSKGKHQYRKIVDK